MQYTRTDATDGNASATYVNPGLVMRSPAKARTFAGFKVLLALVAVAAGHSGLAAQDSASDRAFFPAADARLEVAVPALLARSDTSAVRTWERDTEASGRVALTRTLENRRPLFSARGAAYGAAIGCAVGAVVYYDPEIPEISQRLGWSGMMCAYLTLPGAYFGAVFIR